MERIQGISLTKIKIDTAWNCADNYERLKMHNIHAYPAISFNGHSCVNKSGTEKCRLYEQRSK